MFGLYDHFHLRNLFNRELFEIYFLLFFRNLSLAMIGLFLPLYLFIDVGFSLTETIAFFVIWTLSFTVFLLIATNFVLKYGTKHSMILSIPFMILAIVLILLIQYYPFLIYIAAFFYGIPQAFFWMGFHIDAVMNGKKRDFGKESALIDSISIIPGVIGPLFGGVILKFLGFNFLFGISLFFGMISIFPLFFSKEVFAKDGLEMAGFFDLRHLRYFYAYFCEGVSYVSAGIFWPLFVFFIFGSYISLGLYGSFITLLVSIFVLFIGKLIDDGKSRFSLKVSVIFCSLIRFLKAFVQNIFQIYFLGVFLGLAGETFAVIYLSKTYRNARKERISFILFRELSLRIGQLSILLLVLVFGSLKLGFVVSGFLWAVLSIFV